MKTYLTLALLVLYICSVSAQKKTYQQHLVAFYNAENLFDTIKDARKFDQEFTPESKKRWNTEKYLQKVDKIAQVLSSIHTQEQPQVLPTIIGLCEIENQQVLQDLVSHPLLKTNNYRVVHFDSPDLRGIDVALLYQKDHFYPTQISKHPLILYKENGKRLYTRDQLLVTGLLQNEEIHIIVNHWPSRFGGEKKSMPNRLAAAKLNRKIIDSLFKINPQAKIITMGDFNDGPNDVSISEVLQAYPLEKANQIPEALFNPMHAIYTKNGLGTLAYNDVWELFDQIIFSQSFSNKDYRTWQFRYAQIANLPFLVQSSGKYKGYPLRSNSEKAGYSDHFPVFAVLVKEKD